MFQFMLAPLFVAMVMGEGCCPPDAWEGYAGFMVGWTKGIQHHLTKGVLTLHVNITLGMIAMEQELLVDYIRVKQKVILDYNKKTEYVIKNDKCTKTTLESSIPRCLPANSTLVDYTYLGAGSKTMAVKIYRFYYRGLETYFTVNAQDCIPVVAISSGNLPNMKASLMEVFEYSGITMGVEHPSVFDIPAICHPIEISTGYSPIIGHWMRSAFN